VDSSDIHCCACLGIEFKVLECTHSGAESDEEENKLRALTYKKAEDTFYLSNQYLRC